MLYGWYDIGSCSSLINSSPYIDPSIWQKESELWFVSLKDFIPLLYSPVFVRLGLLNSGSLTAILPYSPASQSSLHSGCWHIFSRYWFSCAVIFWDVSLLSRKLMTDENVLCFFFFLYTFSLVLSRFLVSRYHPLGFFLIKFLCLIIPLKNNYLLPFFMSKFMCFGYFVEKKVFIRKKIVK